MRKHDSFSSVLLSQDCFGYLGIFLFPRNYLLQFCEKSQWCFDRDCIESLDCLGQYGYFNNIYPSNSRTGYIFPCVCIMFDFLLAFKIFRVQVFGLLRFIPRCFILFDAMVNEIVSLISFFLSFLFFFFTSCMWTLFFFSFVFYFTILYWFCHTSTCICHRCTRVPYPEPLSYLSPHTISLGHLSAPAPSFLYPTSNLDW